MPATLRAGDLRPRAPLRPPAEMREITKKSLPPVAELDLPHAAMQSPARAHAPSPTASSPSRARPGRPTCSSSSIGGAPISSAPTGPTGISSVHSGHPQDSVDVTALLVPAATRHRCARRWWSSSARPAWKRRANLLAPLTVFLRVKDAGRYEVLLEGPEARARIEPFLTYRPERYKSPPCRGSGSTWDLDARLLRVHRRAREARHRDLHRPRQGRRRHGPRRRGRGAAAAPSPGARGRRVPEGGPRPRPRATPST